MTSLDPASLGRALENGWIEGIGTGIILAVAVQLGVWFSKRWQLRHVTKFWRPFSGKAVTIVYGEWPASAVGEDSLAKLARKVGGRFMTRGMAMAVHAVHDFVQHRLGISKTQIEVKGSHASGEIHHRNIVSLGSPVSNDVTGALYARLGERFDLPYWIGKSQDGDEIAVRLPRNMKLPSQVENGHGHDYAVVVKATISDRPSGHVMLLSGGMMYGTHAAALAVSDPEFMKALARGFGKAENVAFVLKVQIHDHWPVPASIALAQADGEALVQVLQPRNPAKP